MYQMHPVWRIKLRAAQQAAEFLARRVKSVRAIGLTGSVAYGDVALDDDLDFLVITATNRVYTTRFWTYFWTEIKGKKRRPTQEKDRWCLNLFLAADHLVIPSVKRSRFAALQLARLRPLVDPKNLCLRLWHANLFWTKKYLSLSEYPRQLMSLTSAKSVPLVNTSTILGDLWENFWRESQLLYMRPKITREVVNRQQIFFHPLKRE